MVDLGNAIEYAGDTVSKLREAVDGYFKAVEEAMERKIEEFRRELEAARQVLSAAQDALSACRASRYYDDEKEEWVEPNCSCEERDVRQAEKEVNRLEKIVKRLEDIKSNTEYEIDKYRQPGGMISPPGGDGVLSMLGESYTNEATDRMQAILEVVEKYLRVNIHSNGSTLSIDDSADSAIMGYTSGEEKKAEAFRSGIERILQRQKDQNYGDRKINEANAVTLCPRCHRPFPIACICENIRERATIFNYDLSR